jgi:hypothetical protein
MAGRKAELFASRIYQIVGRDYQAGHPEALHFPPAIAKQYRRRVKRFKGAILVQNRRDLGNVSLEMIGTGLRISARAEGDLGMRRFALITALISALIAASDANAQSRRCGGFVRALIGAGIAAALGSSNGAAKPSEKDYRDGVLRPAQLKECLLTAHRTDLEDE